MVKNQQNSYLFLWGNEKGAVGIVYLPFAGEARGDFFHTSSYFALGAVDSGKENLVFRRREREKWGFPFFYSYPRPISQAWLDQK